MMMELQFQKINFGTDVAGKKVQTLEFTRTAKVNLVTGEVEYGTWTPKTTADFEAVPTPTIDGYTSTLVSNPTTSDVPAKTVTADDRRTRRSSCLQNKTNYNLIQMIQTLILKNQ